MQKKILLFAILLLFFNSFHLFAQDIKINKIEPPNWWQGMQLNEIQLMVYGENLNNLKIESSDESVKILKVHEIENPTYTFVDISISQQLENEKIILSFSNDEVSFEMEYPIYQREKFYSSFQGFDNTDIIYLLMPDRFANGDISNDEVEGYIDNMQSIPGQGRSGGDIQGVINKLDYLKDFGVTTLWLNPVLENNTFRSYHGYAATDFYNVDPRLGSNELYKKLVEEAHKKDLKIIIDHVANHFSHDHPWMKNLPTKDWINGSFEDHLPANHNKMVFTDPYADSVTIKQVEQGWFVDTMPDLNQANPFVANYITQNTIWWIEYTGLDGIREDTYPYCNQKYMAEWAKTILDEYPTLNILGEVWTGEPAFLAGYQKGSKLRTNYDTNIPALTDFGFRDVIYNYLNKDEPLSKVHDVLAKDYLFADPTNLVTFIDNHDIVRALYAANGNIEKVKLAYTLLLCTRGIPSIFYGSELAVMDGPEHGDLRISFPGGFEGDERDAFTSAGRNEKENDMFDFLKKMISLRKKHKALSIGKLTHYPSSGNIYGFTREYKDEKLFVICNGNDSILELPIAELTDILGEVEEIANIEEGEILQINENELINIQPYGWKIYKLRK